MVYKEFIIEKLFGGYTVCYQGDEVFFDTIEQAKAFIDEVTQ